MVKYFSKPVFLAVLICICFFYIPVFNFSPVKKIISMVSPEDILYLRGTLISSPVKTSSGKTYSCKILLEEIEGKNGIKSSAKGTSTVLIPSNLVEAYYPGKLYSASNNTNYIYEAGGTYLFKVRYFSDFFTVTDCLDCIWKKDIYGKIDYFRALCRLQFKRLMYAWGNAGGLLLALLSGSREYTEEITKEAFKNAGLSHILALSGMHLSMFSAIAVFFGNKIGRKKFTYVFRLITLTVFVWFAGFSPSLLRAFICSLLLLFASIASSKQPNMFIVLCFSFLLQSCISPQDITNVGFMLSYGALSGILLFNPYIDKLTQKIFPQSLATSLSSSISAQSFTVPISLKLFGSFSPIGIVATAIVSPLITVFIYSGLLLILICLVFPGLVAYSGIFVNFLYTIINYIVLFFSKAPRITI